MTITACVQPWLRAALFALLVGGLSASCSMLPGGGGSNDSASQQLSADNRPAGGKSSPIRDNRAARAALKQALRALDNGNREKAAQDFEQVLSHDARSANALNHYAIFLREQWQIEQAETIYLRALKYSPGDAMTHWNIGVLYEVYRGDYARAIDHYQSYQRYAEQPDKRVAAWIADLKRRIEQRKVAAQ